MKKKTVCGMLALMMAASTLAGCGGGGDETAEADANAEAEQPAAEEPAAEEPAAEESEAAETEAEAVESTESASSGTKDFSGDGKIINIYVWNEEFRERFDAVYPEVASPSSENDNTKTILNDGTEVHWITNPNQDGVYQQKLDEALANQESAADDDKIDIFLSEADYVTKYSDAEADVALPLEELGIDPDTDLADQYAYTKTVASDQNGVQRGSTWQCTPGVFVYRRDIAKEVFGTDDPAEVGEKVKDWATLEATAEELKAKGYYMFSSYADTFRAYSNAISDQWVTDGVLTVDQRIMDWVNDSKEWIDAGYFDPTVKGQWTDEWNKSMGSASKVFGFIGVPWFVDFTLKPNWDGEEGAWGITNPPEAFYWGGSYIHGCRGTDNPKYVKDIILEMTANKDNLLKISADYLDFTNTMSGMEEAASDDSFANDFVGGENPFSYYQPAAEKIQIAPLSAYDQGCVEEIQNAFGDYFQGNVDFDKAKANFETAIVERHPDITSVVWPDAAAE